MGFLVLLLAANGCGSVSKERGHDEVDRLVHERTGRHTGWAQGSPEDDQVDKWIGDLLARGLTKTAAVDVAVLNNPRLQETYEELGVSQAEMVRARLLRNPSFGAHVGLPVRSQGPYRSGRVSSIGKVPNRT
jgi:cobalt-zinc-cadmium efflux system outer membrane protein